MMYKCHAVIINYYITIIIRTCKLNINTFHYAMHNSIMKYSSLVKTQNNVTVNNFYSGVTAGTAAISGFANLWILGRQTQNNSFDLSFDLHGFANLWILGEYFRMELHVHYKLEGVYNIIIIYTFIYILMLQLNILKAVLVG